MEWIKLIILRIRLRLISKKIKFIYRSSRHCNLDNPEMSRFGCCCQCQNRLEITKHCWHSNYSKKCNCSDKLGFYVCIVFHDMDKSHNKANLCGEHGVCECFIKKDLK